MKKLNKCIVIILIFLFSGCFYPFVPYKPSIAFLVFTHHSYAIIENGKVNRMGIAKNDINKMNRIITNNYGIKFSSNAVSANEREKDVQIIFHNNLKITIGEKKYILKKENIKMRETQDWAPDYLFDDIGINLRETNDNEYILDLGEIEIVDGNGNIIKPKTKIPPILFKKTYYVAIMYNPQATNYDLYYDGWVEDFPEDTTTLKRIYTTDKTREAAKFPNLEIKKKYSK